MRQINIGAYLIKNAGKTIENISIEKYVQILAASINQADGKILAAAKNQADGKILAARENQADCKILAAEKISRRIESLRGIEIPALGEKPAFTEKLAEPEKQAKLEKQVACLLFRLGGISNC